MQGAQGIQGLSGTAEPTTPSTITRTRFTATSDQTAFGGLTYSPNYIQVYLNGSHLDQTEYTATNGTTVVLSTGASLNDIIEVVAYDLGNYVPGLQGTQGVQGLSNQGVQGHQGTQGVQGLSNQGVQGLQGTQGVQGLSNQGVQGTQGLQGLQGTQGVQGLSNQGVQGTQGLQGVQGLSNQGVQGTQGLQGVQGLSNQGVQGTQGLQGPTGDNTPAGTVIYLANTSAPTGYLKANGASLSTTTYATLFAAIGYTFGGSGASFNVPDLRGEFVRGWDDARGVDAGRGFGTAQGDDFKSHSHTMRNTGSDNLNSGAFVKTFNYITNTGTLSDTGDTGGTETRPRNIALLACIKY